jgi:hypothetical protein
MAKGNGETITPRLYSNHYLPGGRGSIKTKNRDYWRYEMERESAIRRNSQKTLSGAP